MYLSGQHGSQLSLHMQKNLGLHHSLVRDGFEDHQILVKKEHRQWWIHPAFKAHEVRNRGYQCLHEMDPIQQKLWKMCFYLQIWVWLGRWSKTGPNESHAKIQHLRNPDIYYTRNTQCLGKFSVNVSIPQCQFGIKLGCLRNHKRTWVFGWVRPRNCHRLKCLVNWWLFPGLTQPNIPVQELFLF